MRHRSKKPRGETAAKGGRAEPHHSRHHRSGRRPKLGRFFAHGDLRFLILKLIAEKPRHGYELIKAIEDLVAGAYSPSPGVIYPTLTLLEELDWIQASPSEGSKKLFEITQEGTLALAANKSTVEAIFARMAEVTDAQENDSALDSAIAAGPGMPQLKLALDDLKRAIEHRLAGDPLTKDQADAIVAALSSAADQVERV